MFAGGAASQEEVHLSSEIHSEVDEGVCIEDMTLLDLYKLILFQPSAQKCTTTIGIR